MSKDARRFDLTLLLIVCLATILWLVGAHLFMFNSSPSSSTQAQAGQGSPASAGSFLPAGAKTGSHSYHCVRSGTLLISARSPIYPPCSTKTKR
jgi:hypothetical protein